MYTLLELQSKTLGALKEIGCQLNIVPAGDRRCRQSWIDALVPPPLLQLLEDSPAVSVEHVQEAIEVQAQEPPLESKFGRIVYPRPAQDVIAQAAETSPAVSVEQVQEAIEQAAENSPGVDPGVDVERVQEPIAQAVANTPSVEVDRVQEPLVEAVETSPGVDLVEDELPGCSNCFGDGYIEDEFGFVKFCQCETEPRLSHQRTRRAIAQAAQKSPGVDCVYCHSPEYESLRDESYRCYKCQPDETDLNPIGSPEFMV